MGIALAILPLPPEGMGQGPMGIALATLPLPPEGIGQGPMGIAIAYVADIVTTAPRTRAERFNHLDCIAFSPLA
jgi:hypothetical protein